MTRAAIQLRAGRLTKTAALTAGTALLLTACGGGGGDNDPGVNTPPVRVGTLSGKVNYEFVPPASNCRGLDFASTETRPIRGATVQLIDAATGNVLDSTVSSDSGDYSFSGVDNNKMVRVSVRAELKKTTGTSTWDLEVRDNFIEGASDSDDPAPQHLRERPLYVLEGTDFDTGTSSVTRNLTATTGWTGSAYGGPRSAAPFAILDAIYTATKFVESVDPNATFPPLDAFWSVNNTLTDANDITAGELTASFYIDSLDSLFLVGDAAVDTEEFDDHVIVHEWGHYFEDKFSRSDSPGGAHSIGDRLDPRLAFGEGWATAFAAMALDDPLYCDTGVAGAAAGFGIGAESGSYDARGWYDEISVLRFIYDMFDSTDEGGDSVSIGFAPIYEVMTDPQSTTEAFTTVFSFATALRQQLNAADQLGLDAQLSREDMTPDGLDIWGTLETNDANGSPGVLPIYTDITADGAPSQVCVNSRVGNQSDSNRDGNKLAEYRYLRTNISSTSQYRIQLDTVNPPSIPPPEYDCTTAPDADPNIHLHSDPDLVILGNGVPALPFPEGLSCEPNSEVATTNVLAAGTYVLAINEFRFADSESPVDFPSPGETEVCFNITMQAIN